MTLVNLDTHQTNVKFMLDQFKLLSDQDRQYTALILEKKFGVVNVSDLARSNVVRNLSRLHQFLKQKHKYHQTKFIHSFDSLQIISKFHVLLGDPNNLIMPDTIIGINITSEKIEKGLKTICDLKKLDFPKKLSHKDWQFLKKKIVNIVSTYGLDWTIGDEFALSERLSNGVEY